MKEKNALKALMQLNSFSLFYNLPIMFIQEKLKIDVYYDRRKSAKEPLNAQKIQVKKRKRSKAIMSLL